jgi:hypothetical protein
MNSAFGRHYGTTSPANLTTSLLVLLMTFLINFKEELALSVELDVTLVNNSKLIIFVILGTIVE